MKVNVIISLKERKRKFSISQARINLKKEWLEFLGEKVDVCYNPNIDENMFWIEKATGKEDIYLRKEREVVANFTNNRTNKLRHFISLPPDLLKIFESYSLKRSFETFAEIEDNKLKFYLPNPLEIEKKVFLYKVNKGGIGKTFLTAQTGHGLALLGKKTLILTSDSQNNILNFMSKEKAEVKKGLIRAVLNDEDNIINLRENLDFIPLESNAFDKKFIEKLPLWINEKKKEYDVILIDSVPTMKIDAEFVNLADYIIIPAFCDEATIEGILNLLDDIDLNKVLAIQINRFKPRVIEMKYKEVLEKNIKGTPIYLGEPIKDLSFVQTMLDKKKTIWEYTTKKVEEVQDILSKLLLKITEKLDENEGEI
jgi:ATPase